jgi:hypothetical protein
MLADAWWMLVGWLRLQKHARQGFVPVLAGMFLTMEQTPAGV